MNVLLDTHIWIWWLTPASPLSARERDALDRAAEKRELHLAAISLWEAQVLHARSASNYPCRLRIGFQAQPMSAC